MSKTSFTVSRTSIWSHEVSDEVDARKMLPLFPECSIEHGKYGCFFTKDFLSLGELLEYIDKVEASVIISKEVDKNTLEIYDDYRE